MVSIISVVTPSYRPQRAFLLEAYDSLCAQPLPAGWEWEWLVQLDGKGELPLPLNAVRDKRVRAGDGPRGGAAAARNTALGRSQGRYIRALDADDILVGNTLAQSIELLEAKPEIGWTACAGLDLMPDGSLCEPGVKPRAGLLPLESVAEYWNSHDYELQMLPSSITIRRELIFAVGGWTGLTTSEDTGLLFAANTLAPGWFFSEPGLHYRQHPGQVTRTAAHERDKASRRDFLNARIAALRPYRAVGMGSPPGS